MCGGDGREKQRDATPPFLFWVGVVVSFRTAVMMLFVVVFNGTISPKMGHISVGRCAVYQ